jgi:hypothetical protein
MRQVLKIEFLNELKRSKLKNPVHVGDNTPEQDFNLFFPFYFYLFPLVQIFYLDILRIFLRL